MTRAADAEPFLCLSLDPVRIATLVPKIFPDGLPSKLPTESVGTTGTDPEISDAAFRLVEALSDPRDGGLLAGLSYEELFFRCLRSPVGNRIAQIAVADSAALGISRSIA